MDLRSEPSGRKRRPIADRFWANVRRGRPSECWNWTAAKNGKGYGRLTAGRGVYLKAHRVAYALTHDGVLDDSAHVLHHCDNPSCCNPKHLFVGTQKDNTKDMMEKGRNSPPPRRYGADHHNTKFDAATARRIAADKRTLNQVAADYGISWMTVFRLRHKQTWKKL